MQDTYVKRFNGKLCEDYLSVNNFQDLLEARRIVYAWRRDYNKRRLHSCLISLALAAFALWVGHDKDADSVSLKNATGMFQFTVVLVMTR